MSAICPQIRTSGSCTSSSCEYTHTVLTCQSCGFMCASRREMDHHSQSKEHLDKIRGESHILHCPLCRISVCGHSGWNAHLRSRSHAHSACQNGVNPSAVTPEDVQRIANHTLCVTCQEHIRDRYWDRHVRSQKHLEKERFATFQVVLDDAEKNKNGVTLEGDFDFGFVDLAETSVGKVVRGTISTSLTAHITLVDIQLASTKGSAPTYTGYAAYL